MSFIMQITKNSSVVPLGQVDFSTELKFLEFQVHSIPENVPVEMSENQIIKKENYFQETFYHNW